MKTRLAAALAGLVGLLAAGLVSLPAQATETQPDPVCATWKMRGATGAYPAVVFGGPPEGSSVTASSAKLVKPEGVQPGVEFAAKDLDVEAPAGDEILVGVDYATADGATTAAGAIRLFGYKVNNADTLNDAPNYGPAVAGAESGHLVLTIPAGEKLGTLGVVYDASNSSTGSVTFSNMTIDGKPVQFTECEDPEPTPTATATPGPTQTAEPTPGATGTPEPTESAAPVPGLPVTGSTPLTVALVGGGALVLGVLMFWLAYRRPSRVTFRS